MSIEAIRWAFRQNAPATQRLVLLALADCANESMKAWPSVSTISDKTGLKDRSIRSSIQSLIEADLISPVETNHKSKCYRLNLENGFQDGHDTGTRCRSGGIKCQDKAARDADRPAPDAGEPALNAGGPARDADNPSITPKEPSAKQQHAHAPAQPTPGSSEARTGQRPSERLKAEIDSRWMRLGVRCERIAGSDKPSRMPGRSVLGFARQWLADAVNQGIDLNTAERLIIETVERITSRSGTGKPLKYFENPVSEAFAWHCENVEIDAIREEGSPRSYSEETKNAYRRYCNDLREAGVPPGERLSLDEWALTIEKSNVAA